jgi:hypothetical protein
MAQTVTLVHDEEGRHKSGTPKERITKLDAAKRQLRTAIRLFFSERDSVSTHTLTAASHEVLRAISKKHGYPSGLLKDADYIKPKKFKKFINVVNAPQNFFKHANTDIDGTLDFIPELTTFYLVDCVMMYSMIAGHDLRETWLFSVWFSLAYPEFTTLEPLRDIAKKVIGAETLTKAMCKDFLEHPEKLAWPQGLEEEPNEG